MSNEGDKNSVPPEARRRGGMDTLFSAAWFDEDAAKGNTPAGADRADAAAKGGAAGASAAAPAEKEPPPKSNTMLYVGVAVVLMMLVGGAVCAGGAGAVGAWFYFSSMAVQSSISIPE